MGWGQIFGMIYHLKIILVERLEMRTCRLCRQYRGLGDFSWFMGLVAFFHLVGKYARRKQPFKMEVTLSITFLGAFSGAMLVTRCFLGAFRLERCFIIFSTV